MSFPCEELSASVRNTAAVLFVPTASAVLSDKLPAGCLNDDQMKTVERVKNGLDEKISFICPYESLKYAGVEEELQVFYKTDHHWNANGAAEAGR